MAKKLHSVLVYFEAYDDDPNPIHVEGKLLANICEHCGSLFFGEKSRHYRSLHPGKKIAMIDNPSTDEYKVIDGA